MLVALNGKSYKDFNEEIVNRDSTELGKTLVGYVDRKGDIFLI